MEGDLMTKTVRSLVFAAVLLSQVRAAELTAATSPSQRIVESQFAPDQPPPPLPLEAIFASPQSLELMIRAARDGTVRSVVVSKPSQIKELDEYTRKWVELKWKMPAAKPEDPDLRTFMAPFIYSKGTKWPKESKHPMPPYPSRMLRERKEGIVVLDIEFSDAGQVETTSVVFSSGNQILDQSTEDWVRKKWSLPPGNKGLYRAPFAYLSKR